MATVLNSTVLDDFFFDILSRLPISRFSPVYTSSSRVNSQKFLLFFSKAVNLSFGQYYMVNLPCCQVQWSLQCIHHMLLCITLDTVPHCSLLLSLWRWGLQMVECFRAETLPVSVFPLHILSARYKTSTFKRKRTIIKKFLPLEVYKGLLNWEMKTTRESG